MRLKKIQKRLLALGSIMTLLLVTLPCLCPSSFASSVASSSFHQCCENSSPSQTKLSRDNRCCERHDVTSITKGLPNFNDHLSFAILAVHSFASESLTPRSSQLARPNVGPLISSQKIYLIIHSIRS